MVKTCNICNRRFSHETNLTKHTNEKKCKPPITIDERIMKLQKMSAETKIDHAFLKNVILEKEEIKAKEIVEEIAYEIQLVNIVEVTDEIPVAKIVKIVEETVNEKVVCKNK